VHQQAATRWLCRLVAAGGLRQKYQLFRGRDQLSDSLPAQVGYFRNTTMAKSSGELERGLGGRRGPVGAHEPLLITLAQLGATFDLGETAPDPVSLSGRQRIVQTFQANEAAGTHLLCLVLTYAPLCLGLAVVSTEEKDGRVFAASGPLSPLGFRSDIVEHRLAHAWMLPGIAAPVNMRAGNSLGSERASQ
jgi:hypothetical protein